LWRWIIKAIRTKPACPAARAAKGPALPLAAAAAIALLSGCRQDMHNQPKFVPQRSTTFFADGRSARPQVEHTVARNEVDEDDYFHTGLVNGKEQDALPFPATAQVLARGQERFNIYCTPCHSRVGNGAGMIVQRGYKPAGNFHDAKRLAEPLSHYFYVMTNGYGAMPDYSAQLPPEDRWAVAAYIRALQLSQNASSSDVPSGAKVDSLADIAAAEGYDAEAAGPWPMPTETNVQAIAPDQAPAVSAPAPPAAPKIQTHPAAKAPEGDSAKPAAGGN
jgi:mono/diheme cytochrome c family protein